MDMVNLLPWVWGLFLTLCHGDLRVRVSPRNPQELQGMTLTGDLDRQLGVFDLDVRGNDTHDTVLIEFKWPDGSVVSQLTDFKRQSQIMRVKMLGETELGQPPFQVFCFVSSFTGDLIPPEAITKLHQRNASAIRFADDDRGEIVQDSPLLVDKNPLKSAVITSHLSSFCEEALETTFSSEHELYSILDQSGIASSVSSVSREAIENSKHMPRCFAVQDLRHPCICSLRICMHWYPCALKYCKGDDNDVERRCGIRTCKKCNVFRFPVREKYLCIWDEV